jgi:proteasome lid subunit RPN8/RPN11
MITTDSVLTDIRQHGADAYPEEGCGFLLGTVTDAGVNRVARRMAAAQEQGLDVVGVYHSHPDHPAEPSETDLDEATFPGYTYVIVAVHDGTPEDLTAWTLAPDRSEFRREDIAVSTPEEA